MSVSSQEGRKSCSLGQKKLGGAQSILGKNETCVIGMVEEDFQYSHMSFAERFYKTRVMVKRLSGTIDFVPIVVSETLRREFHGVHEKGLLVKVTGRFSSNYAVGEDRKKHLYLFLYVYTLSVYENEEDIDEEDNKNFILLQGTICKQPALRKTPLGRDIADVILAVKRDSNIRKSDYIPCIFWGNHAKHVSQLNVGDFVSVQGRIQSREYFKRYNPGEEVGEYRTAYEVSVMEIKD